MSSILKFLRDLCCCCIKDLSDALFAAGVEAWTKYEETGESQYLAEAVRNHHAALDIRLPDHPRRPESLLHTAMALWAQCQDGAVTQESSSIVIAYYNAALHLSPDKLDRRATIYTNLGTVYFTLFRLEKGDPEVFPATGSDINKTIENYRSALQLRPAKDDPDRPTSLINLSIALIHKGSKDDLMDAITNLREAVKLCTTKPLLLLSLNNLAQAYDGHYRYSGDISDVLGRVDALRRVQGKGRLVPLVNLTNAFGTLCEIEPNRSKDLDEAVLRGREALKLSDGSDNIIRLEALITLANVLTARYDQISPKNVADLDQAIQYYRDAIDLDTKDGPDPILCSNIASAIFIRCQDFEEVERVKLEDAMSYNQKALRACPNDDPLYLRIKNNLGCLYLTQFSKSGAESDLVKGIRAYEDVVSHCPDDNGDSTVYQEILNSAKRALQGKRAGHSELLDQSVLTRSHYRSQSGSARSLASSVSARSMARSSAESSISSPSLRSPTKQESSFTPSPRSAIMN